MKTCRQQHNARPPLRRASHLLASIVFGSLLAAPATGVTPQYQRLRSFGPPSIDGFHPTRQLLEASDGALYGLTANGGNLGGGTVFRINQDGTGRVVLHHFDMDASDPMDPYAEGPNGSLIEGTDGALYGTTRNGGPNGDGSVFKLNKDGSGYTILHHFQFSGPFNIEGSRAGLCEGSDGTLYGTTWGGGEFIDENGFGQGTVFKLNKNGSGFDILHSFSTNGVAGMRPSSEVIEGADGALYGTTFGGAGTDAGVVFKLNKDGGGFTVLHEFGSAEGGHGFAALVEGTDGRLYGTSYQGGVHDGGFVFRLNNDGTGYTNLHSFGGSAADGSAPEGRLCEGSDGTLYGTTRRGGAATNQWGETYGTIFKLNKDGSGYAMLHNFTGSPGDGDEVLSGLVEGSDGRLYGTTSEGGADNVGTLFSLSKGGTGYAIFHHFQAEPGDALKPLAVLTEASDGRLYGTTSGGGSNYMGTVFVMNRDGSDYALLHQFSSVAGNGTGPRAPLLEASDGRLYGTTSVGGGAGFNGTVFRVNKDGGGYTILHRFSDRGADGAEPHAGLIEGRDGMLYGTTAYGGRGSRGTVFGLKPDGSGYAVLRHFTGAANDGGNPEGALLQGSDGVLYGTGSAGGSMDLGTVFKLNKDGTGFGMLHSFAGTNGFYPLAGLLEASDGALYGTASSGGGINGAGTVFKLNKDGTGFVLLHRFEFGSNDGHYPVGGLVEGSDGALYGTTSWSGGNTAIGTVFKVNKNGTGFAVVHSFSGSDGSSPQAGLLRARDGAFYGTTSEGGDWQSGTVFRLHWPVAITRFQHTGNTSLLDWTGVPNWPYRVQVRTNLIPAQDNWVELGTHTTGPDGTCWLTVPESPNSPARFYRVVWP